MRVLLVADQLLLVEDAPLAERTEGVRFRNVVQFWILNSIIQMTEVLLAA